jgi:hypothetical protein
MPKPKVVNVKRTPLGNMTETERQFQIVLFRDRYKTPCSLQQSSLADFEQPGSSAVWLGVDRQDGPRDGMFDAANHTRVHLDVKQVRALIAVLEMWVQTGYFAE